MPGRDIGDGLVDTAEESVQLLRLRHGQILTDVGFFQNAAHTPSAQSPRQSAG
ncbi:MULTISPECIES: hypothetical protein [Streptomyces]|uniref:hypothetical protein n=1 Tax=Streptomyces TaxID=1883 RepID=UPI00240DB666|nr:MULTISPECIES: hypothetical protein [Streptomyces]WFB88557.1 hypothetical protein MMU79_37625 [Streptomyces olivaceus]WGK50698.1 hypothetical protein M6G09_36650 [Streptomyces sp. B146]